MLQHVSKSEWMSMNICSQFCSHLFHSLWVFIVAAIEDVAVLVAAHSLPTQQLRTIIVTKVAAQVDSTSRQPGHVNTCSVKGKKPRLALLWIYVAIQILQRHHAAEQSGTGVSMTRHAKTTRMTMIMSLEWRMGEYQLSVLALILQARDSFCSQITTQMFTIQFFHAEWASSNAKMIVNPGKQR